MANRIKWCLVGIPDHQGVENVGGRLGAAQGPAAIWRAFTRLKGRDGVHETLATTTWVQGLGADVSMNHALASEAITDQHRHYPISVVVGGGHDHGFSHLLGLKRAFPAKARIGCINIDAHLDLRKPNPKISSGSPFYLAIEEGVIRGEDLVEFGIQAHCNAPELWEYAELNKVQIIKYETLRNGGALPGFKKALRNLAKKTDFIVISLDLDAIAEGFAPGVSAPQAEGFTPSEIFEMLELAGDEEKVVSLGVFELNPLHDRGDQTARLAATSIYHFIARAKARKT